ncbi:MAG: phosphoribosyl-AMP cyclohydrolase [Burkholderiaceae bacterium]
MTIETTSTIPDWLDDVTWNDDGLVAAIAQEVGSGDVLMLAWMNREALAETLERGEAVYWSRSRNQLWHKGDTSGHFQRIHDMRLDCDGDAILLKVEQVGRIACHTGRHSCFSRSLDGKAWTEIGTPLDELPAKHS